jgi:hypothetical protein
VPNIGKSYSKRGEKRSKPKKKCDKNEAHVSIFKMILKTN